MSGPIQTPHHPGAILLAAQARAERIRQQDERLKREIEWLAQLTKLSYERRAGMCCATAACCAKLVLKSNSHISKRQFLKLVHRPREVID